MVDCCTKIAKTAPEWSAGRTHKDLHPYYMGHVFISYYFRHRGMTYKEIGAAIGVTAPVARQKVLQAKRIIIFYEHHQRKPDDEQINLIELTPPT